MKKIISFVLLSILLVSVLLSFASCGRIENGSYVYYSPYIYSYEVKGNRIHVFSSCNYEYVYSYKIDQDDIITFKREEIIEHRWQDRDEIGYDPLRWELTELNGSKFTKTKFGFCIGDESFVRID